MRRIKFIAWDKKRIIYLIGLTVLMIVLVACEDKQNSLKEGDYIECTDECNITAAGNSTANIQDAYVVDNDTILLSKEELQHRCFKENSYYCSRACSEESGLIFSDEDYLSYNGKQFDKDDDGNYSEHEMRNWEYIIKKQTVCYHECSEIMVHPCFR